MTKREEFTLELKSLINRLSLEQFSDTPDFILAEYLVDCLDTFDKTVRDRDRWWRFKPDPVG